MKEWKKGVQEVISDFFSQKMLKMDFSADRQKEFNNMEKKLTKALQVAPYQLQALYVSMSYREHSVQGGLVGVLNKQPSVIMLTFQWGPAPLLTQLVWGPAPMLSQLGL